VVNKNQHLLQHIALQYGFVIFATVENADDGHQIIRHIKSDSYALAVMRNVQAGPDVIAPGTTQRECAQVFTFANNGFGISGADATAM